MHSERESSLYETTDMVAATIQPLLPAASLDSSDTIQKLDVISNSLIVLGGLNLLSQSVAQAVGYRCDHNCSASIIGGVSRMIGTEMIATALYFLIGCAAVYMLVLRYAMRIKGDELKEADRIYNWVYLGVVTLIATVGGYALTLHHGVDHEFPDWWSKGRR